VFPCAVSPRSGIEKTTKKDGALVMKTQNPGFYKCWQLKTTIPGPVLKIQCWDHDDLSGDDIIGETIIDLENRSVPACLCAAFPVLHILSELTRRFICLSQSLLPALEGPRAQAAGVPLSVERRVSLTARQTGDVHRDFDREGSCSVRFRVIFCSSFSPSLMVHTVAD
jgi:hypothetical protein